MQTAAYEDNRYSGMLARLDTYTENANAGGLEPAVVAAAILKALEDHRPRPDQLIMKRGWMAKLVLRLPKRLQDKLIRRNLDRDRRY